MEFEVHNYVTYHTSPKYQYAAKLQ